MPGERAQQHQGRAQLSQASIYFNIKFSTVPTLAEEQMHMEGEVQIQPWQRCRLGGLHRCHQRQGPDGNSPNSKQLL